MRKILYSFQIQPEFLEKIRNEAQKKEITVSEMMRKIIAEWILKNAQ